MIADPQRPVAMLPLQTEAQRRQVLEQFNSTAVAYPEEHLLHRLFEEQVQRCPDAVAVWCEGRQLTYRELDRQANQLAHYLRRHGVGPDLLVGICMERSAELMVSLLGVLKAGGAYVPLDPDYPAARLAYMLRDAQVPVVLTQSSLLDRLPGDAALLLCLDCEDAQLTRESGDPLAADVSPYHLAYVIYTSGSTGQPKGAMNTHRAICNRLLWMQQQYRLSTADSVLQKTPCGFDVSVWEFFWPLLAGARLVLAQPGGHKDPGYLAQLVRAQGITVCHFVPAMLQAFLDEAGLERSCATLRDVICSGEALPRELAEGFLARIPARLHNLYGPTEAAVDVSFWECRPGEPGPVPIGRPVANTGLYVLDERMRPVPVGVPGELYIGGVQIARGYWGRPTQTAERFIPDPFSDAPEALMYRTGDRARWRPDGALDFLGRLDHQVKVRGFRIELGEIETTLRQHPAIRQAAVVARPDAIGGTRLVAYVVPRGEAVSAGELSSHLRQRLPEAMVPSAFVALEAMPLNPNGKVDRNALPAPEGNRDQAGEAYVAPRTAVEETLAAIWREILGLERVGVHDNFFALGGH
jgi:amino acid adenylation domain-containing protein